MKKNFSVNIGGRVFNIDEDAYERLNAYLANLRSYFASEQGRDEILADIESRIAELLEQYKIQGSPAISLEMVNRVIAGMGEPDQLSGNEPERPYTYDASRTHGKLFRNPDSRLLGGVASGIASWFGINPVWIRLLFAGFTFVYGIGAIVYIILWVILPQARTTSEKLEMQRRIINIDSVRNEVLAAGSGLKTTGDTMLHTTHQFFRFLAEVIIHVFRLLLKVLRMASGAFLLMLVLSMFTGLSLAYLIREPMNTGNYYLDTTTLAETFSWLMPGAAVRWPAYIGIALLIVGVSGMFILLGLRLLVKWPPLRWQVTGAFGLLILAGLIFGGAAIYQYSQSTLERATDSHTQVFHQQNKSLHLAMGPTDPGQYWRPLGDKDISKLSRNILGELQISIRPAPGDSLILTSVREASDYQESLAARHLENIQYTYSYQDTLLTLTPFYNFPGKDGMHRQSMELIIGIPVGTTIVMDDEVAWKVNYRDFPDGSDRNGTFQMSPTGLKQIPVEIPAADSIR